MVLRLRQHNIGYTADGFYRAMLRRARYCYGKLSVCPSVCLSVRNVEVLWLQRLEIFKNNFMVS